MPIARTRNRIEPHPAGEQDQQPRQHDTRRDAGIRRHVHELRAHIDVVPATPQEQQRRRTVDQDAGGRHQDHRAFPHRFRRQQPVHRLHADRTDADQQDGGVQQRRQDGAATPAVGAPSGRRPPREPGGAPTQQQTQNVAEIVRRIRQQRHRVGQQAERDLGHDEPEIECRAYGEGTIVPMMAVMMAVVVLVVRHCWCDNAPRSRRWRDEVVVSLPEFHGCYNAIYCNDLRACLTHS